MTLTTSLWHRSKCTGVEHHVRYQYQLSKTQDIFTSQIQTETPYHQPNPGARQPFPLNTTVDDPNFYTLCPQSSAPSICAKVLGLETILLLQQLQRVLFCQGRELALSD
ncbi:hypothetical protein F5B19DRAFT_496508 [Rostrohypoxylon terebratum]|nr:hypothetical protein F5B19DRAFT_496508 [Rostrohypoxylon terebratum]